MKKHFLLFGLLIALFSACKKESFNATTQAKIDDDKIKAYIAANHIDVTKDAATGIYYKLLLVDTGAHPNDTSHVQVSYFGSLLNGTQFQAKTTSLFQLSSTIQGFQKGIPLMGTGGRIRLIVPSALGYGTAGSPDGTVPIPANAPLDFTVDLIGFY